MSTKMVWQTAMMAFFLPRRDAKRWYWADKYVSLVRLADQAASTRAERSHELACPMRPLKRFPALSLLPGHILAHDARWLADGNRLMSEPISASTSSALRRPIPGISEMRRIVSSK